MCDGNINMQSVTHVNIGQEQQYNNNAKITTYVVPGIFDH